MAKEQIAGAVLGLVIGLVAVAIFFLLGFNDTVSAELAKTIFSTLIQVNATLIGFFGIFIIFRLQEFSKSTSVAMEHGFEAVEKRDLIRCQIDDSRVNNRPTLLLDRQYEVYDNTVNSFIDWGYDIKKDKSEFSIVTVSSIIFFVVSISLSVVGMRNIGVQTVDTNWLIYAFLPLYFGIVTQLLSMISFPATRKAKGIDAKTENE